MQLTNEEMDTLNRSTEILSRFVDTGAIKKESFDLFEQMVVSAIDSPEEHKELKHKACTATPFSRLILTHMVGFYNEDNEPSLFTDVNIVNCHIINDVLSFSIYSSGLEERFKSIMDFSFAPVLLMMKDNDSSAYFRLFENESGGQYQIEKCETVNAPFETSLPVVFECTVEKIEGTIFPELTAKIHKVNVIGSTVGENEHFDICKLWAQMKWIKQR